MGSLKSDLQFFFNEAPSYLGYSSSYQSFKFRMEGGKPTASVELPINDGLLKHIRKYNRVYRILVNRFSSEERAMLNGLFNKELLFPLLLTATFGELVGLAVFHPDLNSLLYTEQYQSGPQLRIKKDKITIDQIKRDCKLLLKQLEEKWKNPSDRQILTFNRIQP